MIISKEQIIKYFKSGIKDKKNFRIGIEHEKFLFNSQDNRRVDYSKIKEMFSDLFIDILSFSFTFLDMIFSILPS